jgi:hypothetical protein
MTAPEVISWMRICRPGCVIGPQQQFLQDLEPVMWQEGEMERSMQNSTKLSSRLSVPAHSGKKVNKNKKKASSESSSSMISGDSPKSVKDSVQGRPGQADGLLAARRNRQSTAPSTDSAAIMTTPKRDKTTKSKPIPVTPDSTSQTKSTSSSSSAWT